MKIRDANDVDSVAQYLFHVTLEFASFRKRGLNVDIGVHGLKLSLHFGWTQATHNAKSRVLSVALRME